MDIGVEISLYPLKAQFIPLIHEFLERLSADGRFRVVSNSMSTQVFGQYEDVFDALRRELRTTFEHLEPESGKAVFVMKVFGPLFDAQKSPDGAFEGGVRKA
jgi:uncharacterized protein YqgV (UPF0045/DUF77 family)